MGQRLVRMDSFPLIHSSCLRLCSLYLYYELLIVLKALFLADKHWWGLGGEKHCCLIFGTKEP